MLDLDRFAGEDKVRTLWDPEIGGKGLHLQRIRDKVKKMKLPWQSSG